MRLGVQGKTVKTRTHKKGGAAPEWNQSFVFELKPGLDVFQLEAMDEDPLSNDLIGLASVSLQRLLSEPGREVWVGIRSKGGKESRGEIALSAQFSPYAKPEAASQAPLNTGGSTTAGAAPSTVTDDVPAGNSKQWSVPPRTKAGFLTITAIRGRGLKNMDTFGKQVSECCTRL